jgi:ubiquinone/menaquinone biosynthesis C-methylase UbiE
MPQTAIWEQEYSNAKLVTLGDEPQADVLRFLKFLKKEQRVELENLKILDLGCGTGRNSNYIADLGNEVVGLEISLTALNLAKERARLLGLKVKYLHQSMGEILPFAENSFDLVLDITSSNSLNEQERAIYLSEVFRVLKPNGYFFVRALNKEGDKNAKNLLKTSPGPEPDTYIMKGLKLVERVFSQKDFVERYGQYFKILQLLKKTSYTRFNNQSYKRNFWLAYLQK